MELLWFTPESRLRVLSWEKLTVNAKGKQDKNLQAFLIHLETFC